MFALYFILVQLGGAGICGIVVVFLLGPALKTVSPRLQATTNATAAIRQQRASVLNEALRGIKALKVRQLYIVVIVACTMTVLLLHNLIHTHTHTHTHSH